MAININGTSGISGVDGSAGTPALQGSDTNTGISFGTDEVNVNTGGSTRATVDSSGRLLVGTSSVSSDSTAVFVGRSDGATSAPNLRLEANFTPADGNSLGALLISQTGQTGQNASVRIEGRRDGGTWTSGSSMPGRLVFSTTADGASSPTERMRITNGGYLKASNNGSYASGGPLHEIQQNANTWNTQFTNANATPAGLYIPYSAAAPNGNGNEFIYCSDTAAARFLVKSNGGINNYSANNVNLSDEREKKNIEALESTWDCLKHWELKKFHYNADEDTDAKRYGVIAQQVEEHCPEVISEWVKQKAEPAKLDDEGNELEPAKEEIVRIGVKEQQMYWMAIKALQEAQTRIETLETRLTALEGGAAQ